MLDDEHTYAKISKSSSYFTALLLTYCHVSLVVVEGAIVGISKFQLSDGAIIFAVEVHVINDTIAVTLKRSFHDINVYSNLKSTLRMLKHLVSRYRLFAEIKELFKHRGGKMFAY